MVKIMKNNKKYKSHRGRMVKIMKNNEKYKSHRGRMVKIMKNNESKDCLIQLLFR